jgi:hypothetical protein
VAQGDYTNVNGGYETGCPNASEEGESVVFEMDEEFGEKFNREERNDGGGIRQLVDGSHQLDIQGAFRVLGAKISIEDRCKRSWNLRRLIHP